MGTFLSRITGLIRDRIMFSVFGASAGLDAFIIAMRIPNLFREMLAEGSLGSAFTKVFSEVNVNNPNRAKELLAETLWLVTLCVTIFCVIGILLSPQLIDLMTIMAGSGYGSALSLTATNLSRLLFPILGFMVVGSVIMGALHQQGKFFLTATAPILYNCGYIFGSLVISYHLQDLDYSWITQYFGDPAITGLAIGVLIGALGQTLIQLLGIWKSLLSGHIFPPRIRISPEMKQIFFLMAPMTIAASAAQVNQVIVTNSSASLEPGTVTRLLAAFRLLHLPVALFAVAIGVTALPHMTRSIARAGGKISIEVSKEFQNALELVLWLMAPCLVFYLVNSEDLISLLFESGKFQRNDVLESAAALKGYSFAFIAYGLNKVFQSFYFATNRTKYPMKVSIVSIFSNFLFLNLFIDMGIKGMAIAFTCSLSLNSLLLALGLVKTKLDFDWERCLKSLGILIVSSILALIVQVQSNEFLESSLDQTTGFWASFTKLSTSGVLVGLIMILAGSILLRTNPLNLLKKLRK